MLTRMQPPPQPRRLLDCLIVATLAGVSTGQSVDYGHDIRPLLADRCFACHGPDEAAREAELRLDQRDSVLLDRGGYAVIVPGDPDASELLLRVSDADDPMPPAKHGDPLKPREIELLRDWVTQGAAYATHWAYTPPTEASAPTVSDASWSRTGVDPFVLARLEEHGQAPATRADSRTLVRRLSFDLLGLPPTPEQVAKFERDPSTEAWAQLVEEMLVSDHHAERLTTFWFDLVRYADTTGVHADNYWNISPYRDWVLEAFAQNKPFDQFTREQVAGDLLPDATQSQKVAAAYNRLNLITREGGSQPKEFLARYTADRVRNLSAVWLATTLGCAECHDHKFDPLTTREFYEFGAFFADIEQVGVYSSSRGNDFAPELMLASEEELTTLANLEQQIEERITHIATDSPGLELAREGWQALQTRGKWIVPADLVATSDGDAHFTPQSGGSLLVQGSTSGEETYRVSFAMPASKVMALRLEVLRHDSLPKGGPGRAKNGNLVLSEIEITLDGQRLPIAKSRASYQQPNYPLVKAHDGEWNNSGWAIMKSNRGVEAEAIFEFDTALLAAVSSRSPRIEVSLHQKYGSLHSVGHFRISYTAQEDLPALDPNLRAILALDQETLTPDQIALLREAHRQQAPQLALARSELEQMKKLKSTTQRGIPVVMQTRSVPPMVTRILPRGNWMDDSGEVVTPGVPAAFGPGPELDASANRLDLANWLVDGENPLVARVLVNRLWRMLLGRGLVSSLDDFGVQGTHPTHPLLLDYLARELVDSGWNVRHVIRQIVLSSTYGQASGGDQSADPSNQWFGRQERFRLDAEFVRDNALAVSGLLVREVGGPSVRPYQPEGYWAHLNFPRRTYMASSGRDLYRRALYGHWQRQYLHPSLMAFDAPSRERCVAERPRSNTPQAALALLNDPIFVEASRALAQRVLQEAEASDEQRIDWLWQRVLQRDPRAAEKQLLLELLGDHRAHFQAHPGAALELLAVGASKRDVELSAPEHAAWTSAARVLLNLHETIVRN